MPHNIDTLTGCRSVDTISAVIAEHQSGKTLVASAGRDIFPKSALEGISGGSFTTHTGPLDDLPFGAGHFETIIAGGKVSLFDRPGATHECQRVLAPGGTLIFFTTWIPTTDQALLVDTAVTESGRFGDLGILSIYEADPGQVGLQTAIQSDRRRARKWSVLSDATILSEESPSTIRAHEGAIEPEPESAATTTQTLLTSTNRGDQQ